jgi:Predicted membrane protein (DUF2157)
MTTERYLDEWRNAELITAAQHAALLPLVRRQRFSVFLELNGLLYVGVAAIAGGVAWTVREHFASLGDAVVLVSLTSVLAACAWYCAAHATPYSRDRVAAPTFSFDYVLYLGCLVFASELTFVEYRFHLLGIDWNDYLLASAAVYFAAAYRFDNRFVLSLALSTLAAWFGVKLSVSGLLYGYIHEVTLAYGSAVALAGVVLYRERIKAHFLETYLHVAANAILFALVSRSNGPSGLPWLIVLLAACAAAIERGIRFQRFAFVAYGVLYGYVGVTTMLLRSAVFRVETAGLLYFVLSGSAVVAALVLIARRFGRE